MPYRPISKIGGLGTAWMEGLTAVTENFHRFQNQIGSGVERGIRKATMLLLKESRKLVPVDYGVLKASGYAEVKGKGFDAKGTVGYTAPYAAAVHEKVEMKLQGEPRPGGRGFFWDPQGRAQAKFLEAPSRRFGADMRRIIRTEARLK